MSIRAAVKNSATLGGDASGANQCLQLTDDNKILDFLLAHVGKFDMYVEDDYAAFVRYCFEDPLDAEFFRARFEPKIEHLKLDSLAAGSLRQGGLRRACPPARGRARGGQPSPHRHRLPATLPEDR